MSDAEVKKAHLWARTVLSETAMDSIWTVSGVGTTPPGGWVVLASAIAATAAGVVLAAVSSGAAGVTAPRLSQATLARTGQPDTNATKVRRCHSTKAFLLDDSDMKVSTSWNPQQFEPSTTTPCTNYSEAKVLDALGSSITFANGNASCCASAYFTWVLRPLSWMQVVGRPRGELCIPDGFWENLGWHVANFAMGMHTAELGEQGTYELPACHFPDGLLDSLMDEAQNWACLYAQQAASLSAEELTLFVLPAYSNAVRPEVIPGSEAAADLRRCPAMQAAGASSRAAIPDGTDRFSIEHHGSADGGGSFRTLVNLSPWPGRDRTTTQQSRWHSAGSTQKTTDDARRQAKSDPRKSMLAPSDRRCGLCPVRYTPINDRWCCARYCDWYSSSMDLAVTSRQLSQFGCCVKMNKRCITSK
ncbi:hypothetical protein MMPV_003003 [Pyropia vietnamensis]